MVIYDESWYTYTEAAREDYGIQHASAGRAEVTATKNDQNNNKTEGMHKKTAYLLYNLFNRWHVKNLWSQSDITIVLPLITFYSCAITIPFSDAPSLSVSQSKETTDDTNDLVKESDVDELCTQYAKRSCDHDGDCNVTSTTEIQPNNDVPRNQITGELI